jgi:hypothetical protein
MDHLLQHGASFVKTMRSHDAWGRISLAELTLKRPGVANGRHGQAGRDLIKRERLKDAQKNDRKRHGPAGIEKRYPAHARLSRVAHPSITAIRRHFRLGRGGWTVGVAAPLRGTERLRTLDSGCDALFGARWAASQLLFGTSQDDTLNALWEQFVLQGHQASARDADD